MTNQGDNEPWPPRGKRDFLLPDPGTVNENDGIKRNKEDKQEFDGISRLIIYAVGIGVVLIVLSVAVRLMLWILGVDL